ncbi:hypothetical protein JCM17823_04330 [Halorubrum gandharaense]
MSDTDSSGDADAADAAEASGRRSEVPIDHAFACDDCEAQWYYTRHHCPDCAGTDATTYALGSGEVVSTTTVRTTPPDVRSPNPLAIVRFGEVSLVGQVGDEEVAVGDRVTFGGSHQLRADGQPSPRLVPADDE